jgi:4-alpha-glucanotransferase
VPGTYNEFNWTYRLPTTIEELAKDEDFTRTVEELSHVPAIQKKQPQKGKNNAIYN